MIGTKADLCKVLGITELTLNRWMDRFGDEVPIIERGTNGKPYQFDLAAAASFFRQKQQAEARLKAARDEQLAQLAFPFGGAPPVPQGSNFSLKDQREALQIARLQREEGERTKKLLIAEDIRAVMTDTVSRWNRALHAAVKQFGLDRGLPDSLTRAIENCLADAQREYLNDLPTSLGLPPAHVGNGGMADG